jgi:hypothetical protein
MPPEQDDPRDRQIEALRRYVAELGRPRERSAPETGGEPAPPQRPPATVPWLLLTVLLVAIALVGGILIGQARANVRQASTEEPGATTITLGGTVSTPECKTAVDRANASLAIAVKVQSVLQDYTRIMNQLENGTITSAEAVRLGTPSEVVASIQSAKFDSALADYKKVVDKCRSREP